LELVLVSRRGTQALEHALLEVPPCVAEVVSDLSGSNAKFPAELRVSWPIRFLPIIEIVALEKRVPDILLV
jgi:hypothetical protein